MTPRLRGKSPRCWKLSTRSSGSLPKVWTGRRRRCVLGQMFVPVLPSLMSLLETNGDTQLPCAPPSLPPKFHLGLLSSGEAFAGETGIAGKRNV